MKRSPKLEIPPLVLCRKRGISLPEQIHRALREAITDGILPSGTRLPGSRVFARSLNVSRNSVLAAYERLAADGLISGRTGSGTRVCNHSAALLKMLAAQPDQLPRLRESRYPVNPAPLSDPDGNPIYIHG